MKKLTFEKKVEIIPLISSLFSGAISACSLAIWIFLPKLKEFSAGSMKFNAALSVLAASLAVYVFRYGEKRAQKWAFAVAGLALAIGALTLLEYLLKTDFGFDQLFVSDFPSAESGLHPGRMSPIACVCLILIGGALVLKNVGKYKTFTLSALLMVPLFMITGVAATGYIYNQDSFYQVGPFIRISWETAVACAALGFGILNIEPKNGVLHVLSSGGIGGMTARRLLPVVFLVPTCLGIFWIWARRHDYVDRELGVAIFVMAIVVIFSGVVAVIAKRLDSLQAERETLTQKERNVRARFLSVINNSPLIVWALDKRGIYTLSEGKGLAAIGGSSGKLVGLDHFEIFKDNAKAIEFANKALAGNSFTAEVEFNGRHFTSNYFTTYDDAGAATGFAAVSTDITSELLAQNRAKEREEDFQSIVNHIAQLCWMAEPNGDITWFNNRWYDYTGTTLEEMRGWGWEKVHRPAGLETMLPKWKYSLATGEPWEDTFELRSKTGEYRWFLSRALPIRGAHGKITKWFGTNTDIQDQRNTERQFMDLLENMGDGFFSVDKGWRITQVNRQHEKITHMGRGEQIGKSLFELFPGTADKDSNYWKFYNRAMRERENVDFEEYYPPLNIYTSVSVYPTLDGGLAIFFRDVSNHYIAQNLIEIEKQKFEAIFDESPEAMALLRGPELIFEKINRKYSETLPAHDLLGRAFEDAVPELRDQPFIQLMKNVFETGETYFGRESLVRYFRREQGKIEDVFFDFTYSRVVDGKGMPYGIYIHANEVTEKVLARKRLENISENLKVAIRDRDEFLSIASHELKTPLTSMKLQAEIFQRKAAKGDAGIYDHDKVDILVEQTQRQTLRLTRLVDDMLDVSRIRSGKLKVERERFDFLDLVSDCVLRVTPQFEAAGKTLPEIRGEGDFQGEWDRLRLEQVVTNLLTNALRYGKGKPVRLELSASDTSVLLQVSDSGIGISPEMQARIFDRFERGVSASEVSGLGLGLFIARQIVESHGGNIWVESQLGLGSAFFVKLPRYMAV